ncbi:S8 family serine peptidase [Kangiella sp. HZ709]|uniref:Calx-beta domain-containing protein n=1 Tax=Kangiella sp. HZ709 TaxID=2666328 RepID=UPI0018A1E283|nr:S8 family serine peptidase [Kangiella sp. HZ709]
MKKHFFYSLLVATLASTHSTNINAKILPQVEKEDFIPNQLVAKLKPAPYQKNYSLANLGVSIEMLETSNDYAVINILDKTVILEDKIEELMATGLYEYVEKNYTYYSTLTPNDPSLSSQWYINNTNLNGADINMLAAWDIQNSAPNTLVAVIDDGFDLNHPDLSSNFINDGKCFASDATYCGGNTDAGFTANDQSHGTLVTGTFGATANNAVGIAGASWAVQVLPLKVDLTSSAIIQAVDEAIAQNASIVNMSFGGPSFSQAQFDAYNRALNAGILLVTSAGNGDMNNDKGRIVFPANYDLPNMVSVAATSNNDLITSFSQWGPFTVDIAAPGQGIFTTSINSSYSSTAGTSFSSPLVAGVAALIKENTGATDYKQLKAQLLNGGERSASTIQAKTSFNGTTATGRLDAAKALAPLTTGVVVINKLTIDDSATGNNNGIFDPGETVDLVLTLENVWTAENNISATLSTNSSLFTINTAQANVSTIAQDSTAEVRFEVSASDFIGNETELFTLAMTSDNGDLASRQFYHEISKINPNEVHSQQFQRWFWDEYHAYTVNVPAGATDLVISTTTTNSTDIDLLVGYNEPPVYNITLDPPEGSGFFEYDRTNPDVFVSGNQDGNENVTIAAPKEGVYHIVVVNFAQTFHTYTIEASFNAPAPGSFEINPAAITVNEADGTATVTVERGGTQGAVTVDFATSDGTAIDGSDYTATTGTLSWADGENTAKTFTVAILNDDTVESAETINVSLSNATGGAAIGANGSAVITVNDDDSPGTIQLSATSYSVNESAGTVTITLTRAGGSKGAASVDYATSDNTATAGSDYTSSSGTLTWADGVDSSSTFTINITEDTIDEVNETISITLTNVQGATLGSPTSATVTILDNDAAPTPPPSSGGGGGGGSIGWLISLVLLLRLRKRKAV